MKFSICTLGCKVNLYESEAVINLFKEKGYKLVDFNEKADIYIVNTCTVTNTADSKSRKMIRHARKINEDAVIVVMGCYSQMKSDELSYADVILGTQDKGKAVELVENFIKTKEKQKLIYDVSKVSFEDMKLVKLDDKTRGFVKIQDGCNNYCSYCIIPYSRGCVRSKPKEKVIEEISSLVSNGHKEIVLTGIHTGHYGEDLKEYNFANLLSEIVKINGLERLRISSIEMNEITKEVLNVIQNSNIIVDHMHIPLQSGTDKILKLMNRKYLTEDFYNKICEIRKVRPDISITTDVIVGFPNETEEDFLSTFNFIKKVNFSSLHVFPYSKRDGTKAAKMYNQIDNSIKKQRVHKLLELSKKLEKEYRNKFIGKELPVLIETYDNGIVTGYTSNYLKVTSTGTKDEINTIKNIEIV